MKRIGTFIAMMAISTSAHAATFSFVIGDKRIHIEAPRSCRSSACVSVSSSERLERKSKEEVKIAPVVTPTPVPAPVAVPMPQPACPAATLPAQPVTPIVATVPPPTAPVLASSTTRDVIVPPPPKIEAPKIETPRVERPALEPPKTTSLEPPVAAKPATEPRLSAVSRESEEDPPPLGTWETEGAKGTVRIEHCGRALCGYVLSESSPKGESVLVNMKPKSASVWTGNVYSRASGNTYYGTMELKSPTRLHVEACALFHFVCSGNDWTRIEERPAKLITTSRQGSSARS